MRDRIRKGLLALAVLGAAGLADHDAAANVSSAPGNAFHAYFGSQLSCMNTSSYAAGQNSCSSYIYVVGQVPFSSANPLSLTGLLSHNDWCQAVVTNGVGNGYWIGPQQYGQTAGLAVQTLSLGTPPSVAATALEVWCYLEPGAYIGLVSQ